MTSTRQVRDYFCHTMQQVENRVGDHTFHELFDTWLNGELAKAWDECVTQMPLDLDWKNQYLDLNPYRKDEE